MSNEDLDASRPRPIDYEPAAANERAGVLWLIALLALATQFFVGALGASFVLATRGAGVSASTTQPVHFSDNQTVVIGLVTAVVAAVVLIAANLRLRTAALERLGVSPTKIARGIAFGLSGALAIVPLTFLAAAVSQAAYQKFGLEHPSAHPLLIIFHDQSATWLRTLVVVSAIIVAPIYEELLFRGQIQTACRRSLPRRWSAAARTASAIVATSLIFALFHGEFWMMPPIFVLSLGLGWIYQRSGSLYASMIVHSAFNACSVALVWWQGR